LASAAQAQVLRVAARIRVVSLNERAPGSRFSAGTRTSSSVMSACHLPGLADPPGRDHPRRRRRARRLVRRAAAHPQAAALAAGEISESVARTICAWTDNLPADCRERADEVLLTAALSGLGLRDLAGLAGEIYARAPKTPDGSGDGDEDGDRGEDADTAFGDRAVRLATTFQGAGVLHGDLTPQCAEVVRAVLDALSAPADGEDDRSQAQRYHDALEEAMR
jgi:hypothetical protein